MSWCATWRVGDSDAITTWWWLIAIGRQSVSNCHIPLQWRHNEHDGVLNHQRVYCLLNLLFRHRWKKTSKFRVTGLCKGNSPVTGEFTAQRASNTGNIYTWWRHHDWWRRSFLYMKSTLRKVHWWQRSCCLTQMPGGGITSLMLRLNTYTLRAEWPGQNKRGLGAWDQAYKFVKPL